MSYEILTTRVLGVVIGGHAVVMAIAFAMMGMGVPTALMSLNSRPVAERQRHRLGALAAMLGVSYVAVLFFLTAFSDANERAIDNVLDAGGLAVAVATIRTNLLSEVVIVGGIVSLPYVIFGGLIGVLFRSIEASEYHKIYAADLVGAAIGCVAVIGFLDHFGYRGGVGLVLCTTAVAAAAFSIGNSPLGLATGTGLAACATIFLLSSGAISTIEPHPPLAFLSRDYERKGDPVEEWHTWNSQSRVGLIQTQAEGTGPPKRVYAHENGEGWAVVGRGTSIERLVTMFRPARVLVMFAGVGADMLTIDENCEGRCEINGVEINKQMVEHALSGRFPELNKFFSRPEVTLNLAEGREYLERDHTRYDAILLSWWGAGTSQLVGTSGRLAQFMYTKEAFHTLIEHLTSDGIIVIYNGSKAEILRTLRKVYEENLRSDLRDDVIILKSGVENHDYKEIKFFDTLESMKLILKPSGYSQAEIDIINTIAKEIGLVTVISPNYVDEKYSIYANVIEGRGVDQLNKTLAEQSAVSLKIITDDTPFLNNLIPEFFYFSIGKWLSPTPNPAWQITRALAGAVILLTAVGVTITIFPLVLGSGPSSSWGNMFLLTYFWCLGSGFMFIEIGYVSKLGMVLGNPSLSIAIVLASLIFSSGIGSLSSHRILGGDLVSEKIVAIGAATLAATGIVFYGLFWKQLVAMPVPLKSVVVCLCLLPMGFLMGQLFPYAMARARREDVRLVPLAWAVNSVASTISVSAAFILGPALGFNALVLIGAALYMLIIALPLGARQAQS